MYVLHYRQILSDSSTDIIVVVFYSFNTVKEYDGNSTHPTATMEYLTQCNKAGIPPHELRLKKNCICTIMRNLDINAGVRMSGIILNTLVCFHAFMMGQLVIY